MNGSTINLDWNDNTESDLAGYNVYRSTRANGVYQKMNDSLLSGSSFTDSSADENTVYYYYVTAEDTDHNESGHLTPVAITQPAFFVKCKGFESRIARMGEFHEALPPSFPIKFVPFVPS